MFRFFATKPKIPIKIEYDTKGEKLVMRWAGVSTYLRIGSLVSLGYLYYLYQLDPSSLLGSYSKYTLVIYGLGTSLMFYKFSKFLHRLVLIEGGQVIRIEKYPFGGWGHYNKFILNITSVEGLYPYGGERWYNPLRLGKGFYQLRYAKRVF